MGKVKAAAMFAGGVLLVLAVLQMFPKLNPIVKLPVLTK